MQRFSKEIQSAGTERDQSAFEFGEFRLDAGERLLTRAGEVVPLQAKTFEALLLLVRNSGHLLTKRGMLDALWPNAFVEEANLTNAISQLRKALGDARVIETVPKHGYRFTAEVRTIAGDAVAAPREARLHVALGPPGPQGIKPFVDKICASPAFARSHRMQRFLRYAVECAAKNPNDPVKEYAIGLAVYDKNASFDPQADPIIRVEASRLRTRLLQYYAGEGKDDPIVIEVPKGGYTPVIHVRTPEQLTADGESIAVIPFAGSPGAESSYLVDGISEGLTRRLAQISGLRIAPWSMVFRSREPSKDLALAARYLNVRTLLILRLVDRGESYHVHAEWIDPVRRAHLWGAQYVRKVDEIYGLEDEISVNLAARIAPRLSSRQIAQIGKPYTTDGSAYQLYLKGRRLWNKRTADAITQGLSFYSQAIDHDPGYALAFAGMAESYLTLATFAFISPADSLPRAKAAASRALELDPDLGEARTALACIRAVYDWDWTAAERDFQLAASMAPGYSVAHQWYGACLCARGQFMKGRESLRTALGLDPLSPMIGTQLGVGYYLEQQYKSAIRQFTSVLHLDPGFWAAYHFRGLCYYAEESREDAILNLRKAAELSGDTPFAIAALACVLARSGSADEAAHLLSRLQAPSATEYVPPYSLAVACCGMNRKKEALDHLEQAAGERSPSIALWLQREPLLDPLRREPRFQRVLQAAGLL